MGVVINKQQEVIAVTKGGSGVDVEQAITACVTEFQALVTQAVMVEA